MSRQVFGFFFCVCPANRRCYIRACSLFNDRSDFKQRGLTKDQHLRTNFLIYKCCTEKKQHGDQSLKYFNIVQALFRVPIESVFVFVLICYRASVLTREKVRKHPPRGMATKQTFLHALLKILGSAHTFPASGSRTPTMYWAI